MDAPATDLDAGTNLEKLEPDLAEGSAFASHHAMISSRANPLSARTMMCTLRPKRFRMAKVIFYYRHYCYLPLYCFCGNVPLLAQLRDAQRDASSGTVEALSNRRRKLLPGCHARGRQWHQNPR
jgi:hypothetical protein